MTLQIDGFAKNLQVENVHFVDAEFMELTT